MKNYTPFLLLAFLLTVNTLFAQTSIRKYNQLLEEAKTAETQEDYQTSVLNYSRARLFQPRKNDFLDGRIKNNISTLEYQRTTAEKVAKQAQIDLDQALLSLEKSQNFAQFNTELSVANANAAQALLIAAQDLELAIALAYQNYQIYPTAPQSAQVLQQLLSQTASCRSFNNVGFGVDKFALSQQNDLLALSDRFGRLSLVNRNGKVQSNLQKSGAAFTNLHFSRNGEWLAALDATNRWSVWTLEGTLMATHRMSTPIQQIFFVNNDENVLLINRLGEANLFGFTGTVLKKLGKNVTTATVSMEQELLLARENGRLDWYDKTGGFIKSLFLPQKAVEIKKQKHQLFMATAAGNAELWDTNGSFLLSLPVDNVTQIDFIGQYLLTITATGKIQIWDQRGQLLQHLNAESESLQQATITADSQQLWILNSATELTYCPLLLTTADSLNRSLPELMQAGLQPSPNLLESITDEAVLADVFILLIKQQNWQQAVRLYEKLPTTLQAEPQHLLYYYMAHERMGNDKMAMVEKTEDAHALSLFAAYFYQQKQWEKAFATYQKIVDDETARTPKDVLRWYETGTQLSDSLKVRDLEQFAGENYWLAYGRYFAQRADWENAKIFYDTLVQTQTALSPATIVEWYEVNDQLGKADVTYLQQYKQGGHRRYFADYFLERQNYSQAALFYQKLLQNEPSAEHLLGIYASEKGLGNDKTELLLQADSITYWQQFGDYFLDQNDLEQAKIFYEKLLATEDTPFHRDQVEQIDSDLENYTFAQYFLPRDADKLREYSRYFYEKGKVQAKGQRTEAYRKAAIISEQLLAMEKSRTNRQRLAYFYNLLAWERLAVSDFLGSAAYSLQEKEVKARQKYYRRILPASNLLAGNDKRAKKLYRKYRRKAATGSEGGQPLRNVYIMDLNDFTQNGLVPRPRAEDVEKIMKWLD